jgi:pimeloyl-ACP methyl ester carboxylesterase
MRISVYHSQMRDSKSEFPTIRGLRYHVRTWGDPAHPAFFLLHGWMDVSASFQFVVDCLRRERYVIAPDWRGFGLTQWAPGGYWFPDYYGDLDALIDVYRPGVAVDIVGHSMGGNIVVHYAGARPARVRRVITLEGLGLARSTSDSAPRRLVQWLDAQHEPPRFKPYASFGELAQRLRKNNPRLTQEKADFLARHWGRETENGSIELRSDPRHKVANPYPFRIEESLAIWRRVTAPVLLVNGKDSHIPGWLKDTPEQLAERRGAFRDLREIDIADCGHMMHHDQPERVAEVIEAFLG